ncbi:MAG: MarR family transcriptional regulator [Burkholderiales bacterium]|nr:MarR family transcriptional regulator [Burkholderiales bacterium]MDE1926532.1 MarR family transcriptional regulator [Burkholderiales bacterium]MDE2157906.1 MarR family transcriptional regulator [Burkholderiales bacterium]MDE2503229.1 MarR family transcriptional regulator [Burkholderiales bacterium]
MATSPIEERFSTALHHSARTWRLAVDRRLKDLGLSQAGWMTIAVAAKAARSQSEIARHVGVEGATMVAMLDRLAKAGLITRVPSPTDRRVKLVQLTAAGSRLYAQVRREADAVRHQLLAGVDPARLEDAARLLEQLQAAAEAIQ